jgi:hypothetical protein
MNRKMKEIRMGGLGLLLLLSACEKDTSLSDSDRRVAVVFSTVVADASAGDEALRGAGARRTPETVTIPLDDNLYLNATLMPDPVDELRAALTSGQKVRFAAFNGTTKVGNTVDYTYNGSALVPTGGNPLMVEADNGVTYRFVAYSYYGDPTAVPAETGIALSKRLVWGSTDQAITSGAWAGRTVNINMKHRFFQVRVKVDVGTIASAITAISGVQIEGGKSSVNLTVDRDGTLSGTNATQAVSPTGTGAVKTSEYVHFYPSPTKVNIGSITMTIEGLPKTFSNLSANFTQTLVGGTNYTLVVDVRENRWAHSNIYWDPSLNSGVGALTFDKTPQGHDDYQGVFFKWGSLVGIAPGPISASSMPTDATLYIRNPATGVWDGTTKINTSSFGDYGNIPYLPYSTVINGDPLYQYAGAGNYTGDICQRIDNGWRMPNGITGMHTVNEFGVATDYGSKTLSSYDPEDATGRGSMGNRGITYNSAYGTVWFPAAGGWFHMNNVGREYSSGDNGIYPTGQEGLDSGTSVVFQFYSFGMDFPEDDDSDMETADAVPIRCIKKLPTE